jgi:hypothetical protein
MSDSGMSLCGFLRECCDRADASLPPGRAKATVASVRERLREDLLRVAVGGRLNAGKSTMVNALLGQKLAATDATECTKLVSWFKFGLINEVVIQCKDGQQVVLPAQPLASAVAAAGRPADEIATIEVRSSNQTLARDYTLMDTPGLDALSVLDDLSLTAFGQADVLLYLMPLPGENDVEALTALRDRAGAQGITALAAVGVLSRVDQLGEGTGDPWPQARRTARRYAAELRGLVADVIPVIGLLAETALGDRFSEADMGPLRRLRQFAADDPAALEDALYTPDAFRAHPLLPLSAEDRERLLSLLGSYGIRVALAELERGTQGATALLAALLRHSGVEVLLDQLKRQFVGLADPLRARYAIAALDAASWLGTSQPEIAALTRLRADLDQVKEHPRLRQFDLMNSLVDLEAQRWRASDEAAAELTALATGADLLAQLGLDPAASAAEVRAGLIERVTAWRVLENTSGRAASRHARAVREYLESLCARM